MHVRTPAMRKACCTALLIWLDYWCMHVRPSELLDACSSNGVDLAGLLLKPVATALMHRQYCCCIHVVVPMLQGACCSNTVYLAVRLLHVVMVGVLQGACCKIGACCSLL